MAYCTMLLGLSECGPEIVRVILAPSWSVRKRLLVMDSITRGSSPVIHPEPGVLLGHSTGMCSVQVRASLTLEFSLLAHLRRPPVAPLLDLPSWWVKLWSLSFLMIYSTHRLLPVVLAGGALACGRCPQISRVNSRSIFGDVRRRGLAMEYDNDHSSGREELSAFLGCSMGVHSWT